jgi:hypothetical protein
LSEAEVLKAVEGKLDVPPSREYLKQEVDNIIEVCNLIGKQVADGGLPEFSPGLILDYNRRVLNKLALKKDVIRGEIRRHSVVVGNVYRGAPAEDCRFLIPCALGAGLPHRGIQRGGAPWPLAGSMPCDAEQPLLFVTKKETVVWG